MSDARSDHQVLQAAARWFAHVHAAPDDAHLQARLHAWLDQDARHRQAWLHVETISARFSGLPDGDQAHRVFGDLRRKRQSRRRVLGSLCLLTGGSVLAWSGWQRGWVDSPGAWLAAYRTDLAQVLPLVLADGSRVWLNGASVLDVDFDAHSRRLHLYRGEILVETAADPRPLQVQTRAGLMQPLGTRFSVREHGRETELSVFAGAVQATCADSGQQVRVAAGQSLRFDGSRTSATAKAPAQRQDWSRGVLVAEDMPLGQVIDILRGYRHGHLGLDPALAELRVVGTYPLLDSDRALDMLARALPIRIARTLPWWSSVEPR